MQIVATIAGLVVLVLLLRSLSMRGEGLRADPSRAAGAPLTDDSVRELMLRGSKIEAIKAYRMLHGGGLADAKQAVERLAEQLPSRS